MNLIVSALVRQGESICLVEQRGPWDPAASWMLPGGRVEAEESILAALARELAEETGLTVVGQPHLAFVVDLVTADGRYTALTFSCQWSGDLAPADPDGFVRVAEWVAHDEALRRLAEVEWYDVVPLERYLSGAAQPGAAYSFDRRA